VKRLLVAIFTALMLMGCSGEDIPAGPAAAIEETVVDPLNGKIYSQYNARTTHKKWMVFNYPDYWIHTSPEADTTRIKSTVKGIYKVIDLGNDHFHFHGTVISEVMHDPPKTTIDYRWPFDVPLFIGFESIILGGDDRWREISDLPSR